MRQDHGFDLSLNALPVRRRELVSWVRSLTLCVLIMGLIVRTARHDHGIDLSRCLWRELVS